MNQIIPGSNFIVKYTNEADVSKIFQHIKNNYTVWHYAYMEFIEAPLQAAEIVDAFQGLWIFGA